jgi:hypothetical protein
MLFFCIKINSKFDSMIKILKKRRLIITGLAVLLAFTSCKKEENSNPGSDSETPQNTVEFVEFTLDGQNYRQEYMEGYTLYGTYVQDDGITQTTILSSGSNDIQVNIQTYVDSEESQSLGDYSEPTSQDKTYIILTIDNEAYYSKSGTISFSKYEQHDINAGIEANGTFSGIFFKEDSNGNQIEFTVTNGKFNVNKNS